MNSNTSLHIDKDVFREAARNQWHDIFQHFCSLSPQQLSGKASPCPSCGGRDRFRFDNKHGYGSYYCNQCKPGEGIGLVMKINDWGFDEALSRVGEWLGLKGEPAFQPETRRDIGLSVGKWCEYYAIDKDTQEWVKKKCKPKYIWHWFDNWYIVRLEWIDKDGKRHKLPLQMQKQENGTWRQGSVKENRPILGDYGMQKILIVEGETTRDAAERLVGDEYSVVTWVGGAQAATKTLWYKLKDKDIYIFPDADDQGHEAAHDIYNLVKAFAKTVRKINPPQNVKSGWDLADAEKEKWTKDLVKEYIGQNLTEFNIHDKDDSELGLDEYIKFLGYNENSFYFMSRLEEAVHCFSTADLTKKNLARLADYTKWCDWFPETDKNGEAIYKKVDWDKAAFWLISKSQKVGRYRPNQLRGRGCWRDGAKRVYNFGNRLLVDDKVTGILDYKSQYIYQARESFNIDLDKKLDPEGLQFLSYITKKFAWESPVYADLLIGWLMLAPICGFLDWRPHIWLAGAAGTGKTTILDRFVSVLLGRFCISAEQGTTEAGLRQVMKSDSLPVLMEEAESDSLTAKQVVERLISMARLASSNTKSAIFKGTAHGDAQEFSVNGMYMFVSIAPSLKNKADRDRVSVLSLRGRGTTEWEELEQYLVELEEDEDISDKWFNYAYANAAIISANARTFSNVIATDHGKRFGDQYGALLAGRAMIDSVKMYSPDEAKEWLKDFNLAPFYASTEETQERDVLSSILQSFIHIEFDNQRRELSIGECLEIMADPMKTGRDVIGSKLLNYGIKVEDSRVLFAHNSVQMEKLIGPVKSTSWNDLLSRIEGAERIPNPIWFGGGVGKRRAVSLPLDRVWNND